MAMPVHLKKLLRVRDDIIPRFCDSLPESSSASCGRYGCLSSLAADIHSLLSHPQNHVRRDCPVVERKCVTWAGCSGCVGGVEREPSGDACTA